MNNIFGGELTSKTWLSIHTLGNAARLSSSYGTTEVLVLGTVCYWALRACILCRTTLQPLAAHGGGAVFRLISRHSACGCLSGALLYGMFAAARIVRREGAHKHLDSNDLLHFTGAATDIAVCTRLTECAPSHNLV